MHGSATARGGAPERDAALPHRPPTVVLWDLDNVDPGIAGICQTAAALTALAGPHVYQLASGHPSLLRRRQAALLLAGYVILPAPARRNAADAQLLNAAGWLRRHAGIQEFVVASGDHAFWRLASHASVTVAVRSPGRLSNTLARYATEVVTL